MPIGAISGVAGALPTLPTLPTNPPEGAGGLGGGVGRTGDFGNVFTGALDNVANLQSQADGLAVQAATGDLTDVHEYLIASTQASLATELTVAVRNKALESFNQIMNMPV